MGYSTDFRGRVEIRPPLNPTEVEYLRRFSETRHVHRPQGPYFVEGLGTAEPGGVDHNRTGLGQPGFNCDWTASPDGTAIVWIEIEKSHDATAWIRYLIEHFLAPGAHAQGEPGFEGFSFDHVTNGVIHAQGEDPTDRWQITVTDNTVTSTE